MECFHLESCWELPQESHPTWTDAYWQMELESPRQSCLLAAQSEESLPTQHELESLCQSGESRPICSSWCWHLELQLHVLEFLLHFFPSLEWCVLEWGPTSSQLLEYSHFLEFLPLGPSYLESLPMQCGKEWKPLQQRKQLLVSWLTLLEFHQKFGPIFLFSLELSLLH